MGDTAKACTDRNAKCVATPVQVKKAEVPEVAAKCVAKTCDDYAKDKDTCEKAKGLTCVFTAKVDAKDGEFKCASKTGAKGDKKTACEAAKTLCTAPANGGAACCETKVVKAPVLPVAASCKAKKTESMLPWLLRVHSLLPPPRC